MPHTGWHPPGGWTPPPEPPPPSVWDFQAGRELAALSAEMRHIGAWLARLTQAHEDSRAEAEWHRSDIRERLARLEAKLVHDGKPDDRPSWAEWRKAAKELGAAACFAAGLVIGLFKALHWTMPETMERLLALVHAAHAP